jgi:hypothetical protein
MCSSVSCGVICVFRVAPRHLLVCSATFVHFADRRPVEVIPLRAVRRQTHRSVTWIACAHIPSRNPGGSSSALSSTSLRTDDDENSGPFLLPVGKSIGDGSLGA